MSRVHYSKDLHFFKDNFLLPRPGRPLRMFRGHTRKHLDRLGDGQGEHEAIVIRHLSIDVTDHALIVERLE